MSLNTYVGLVRSFLGRTITAKEFEARYLELFGSDSGSWMSESQRSVLFDLFTDVDAFNDNTEIFDPRQDIDEEELRRCAQVALDKLMELGDE